MNKNNFNIYYILKLLFLLILCLFILTGCSNNNDDKLKGKTQDQINYLEKDLISMLNGFNNISYANYRIEIKQETQSSQTNALIEESKKQGATNGESIQETNQNNNSVENSSNESQMDTSGNNTGKNEQQQSSLPQTPFPPILRTSSLTPICLNSILVLYIAAKSFTSSLKSTLPSEVK